MTAVYQPENVDMNCKQETTQLFGFCAVKTAFASNKLAPEYSVPFLRISTANIPPSKGSNHARNL